jgi:hypothetical protein
MLEYDGFAGARLYYYAAGTRGAQVEKLTAHAASECFA